MKIMKLRKKQKNLKNPENIKKIMEDIEKGINCVTISGEKIKV